MPCVCGINGKMRAREEQSEKLRLKPLFSLLQRSLSFIVGCLLLSSLVSPLHAGIASAINFNFQAAPPAALSPVVTAEGWGIKLMGDRKQNPVSPLQIYLQSQLPQAGAILPPPVAKTSIGMMSHHDHNEESSEAISMAGLAFMQKVQKLYQSLQAVFDWPSPPPVMLASGVGGAGGGDDDGDGDGDDHSHSDKFEWVSQAEFFPWAADAFTQRCLKQKQRLLTILRKKAQWAQGCGNRNLARILRDRIMLIESDRDFLQQQTPYSTSSCQSLVYEWLLRDSLEIRYYDQTVNGIPEGAFWDKRGRQAGSGDGAAGSGVTSKGQTGNSAQPDGEAFHHSSPAASSDKRDERDKEGDSPPPAGKAQPVLAASIICNFCQKTLNEQEVARVLQGSTAEPVVCDACLLPLPQETSGKRKAARKRTRPDLAAPEPKRSKSQPKKRKQNSDHQDEPAAKRANLETEAPSIPDTVEELDKLQEALNFEMNDEESEAAKQLFEHLKRRKLKIKPSLYNLLAKKVDRKDFSTFCTKASVFFGSLIAPIQDTGCLTSMLKNKIHTRDFARRKDSELEYLAGLDTFRSFSSMNHGKGLPKQVDVEAVRGWKVWEVDGEFSMELFRAFSSMNSSRGLPKQADVEAVKGWKVWEVNGEFSMELFRAFSSMNNGKGLPKQADVEAVKGWKVWEVDGEFSMELFRAFSSMNSGKGLPKQDEVKKVLGWPEWKDEDGQFNMELFRAFSSMNNGKGLPKQADVEAVKGWKVWEVDGEFSMELFRAFSSMNSGKGLPKQDEVKKVLGWPEWKDEDGQFSMERFRAFSSMNSSRGLPKQDEVKKVLGWPEWKDEDGRFNMELFRAFSSMNNGKGLPKQADVEAVGWKAWEVNGEFSMELFRAFSSMNNGKGLPKQADVEAVRGWKVWEVNGEFSMELFRAFSSMNSSRGLPKQADVEAVRGWKVWEVDGEFSMELFRAFSSMNSSRGLPKQADVEAVKGWKVWEVDGEFSMELFRAFSSMNHGKGLPKQADVEAVKGWKVWEVDGEFSMELFRAFSSMNHGKGLPKQDEVKKVLGWLRCEETQSGWQLIQAMELFRAFSSMNSGKGLPKQDEVKKVLGWLRCEETQSGSHFQLMIRLHASKGMPDIKQLIQYEQKLALLFANTVNGLDSDDEDEQSCLIKQAALFLSTRMPQYAVHFEDVERFYQQEAGDGGRQLEKLLKLLISYGGRGVSRYLSLNDSDRKALLSTSTLRIPLPLAMKAINDFSPQERKRYLFFNRNLKAPPSKDQWSNIRLQLDRLSSVLKIRDAQRRYLEVVWSLAPPDRDFFLDETRAASVTKLFPSLNALKNLANRHSRQWLKELLEACFQHEQETPSRESIKRLFTALLETQLPLFDHSDIPDYFLSGYMALGDSAILIPVSPPVQTTEALALHFVAAVMGVLSDLFYYRYEANSLMIEQYGGETHLFPIPELEIHDDGIEIANWSTKEFKHFLRVTEFPEHYYLSEDAWQRFCNPEGPVYIQRRRAAACERRSGTAPETIAFQPLSISALMGLLKHNIPIKSTVWASFDYHKYRLPGAAYNQLLNEIEKAAPENIPVSLKDFLEARRQPEEETMPQNEMEAPVSTPPFTVAETLSEKEQFQRLWAELSHKELLVVADLELLAGYKEHMTMEQIVSILKRADVGIETHRLYELRQFLGEKRDGYSRQDPLLLGLPDEVTEYLIEADI